MSFKMGKDFFKLTNGSVYVKKISAKLINKYKNEFLV